MARTPRHRSRPWPTADAGADGLRRRRSIVGGHDCSTPPPGGRLTAVARLAQLELEEMDGVTIASVDGEIDLSNATELEMAIANVVGNDALGLVVNLARVEYLDSSGVTLLFNLMRRVTRRQQRYAVVVPAEAHVREILSLSGAADTLPLHESLDDARRRLGN